ncbi:MAG: ABC transporter substrate-binding protein, partial [Corynebacteriales bacterium]|nr:ABC transporter substrate-binding protein [Mycobacteriales bacterium]
DNGLYFRTAPPDVLQAKPLANLILEDGADRVVVMYQNTAYGEGLAKNVQKNLIAGDVPEGDVLLIAYDEKGRDFSAEVNKAADHDPEYILVIGYDESQSIVKKLNEKGIGPKR